MRLIVSTVSILILILTAAAGIFSQDRCFTPEEAAKAKASISDPTSPPDLPKIRKELIDMQRRHEKLSAEILGDFGKNKPRVPELNEMSRAHLMRACEMIRQNGWLGKTALKPEAFAAFVFILTSNRAADLEREILPVLVEASKKGELEKPILAGIVDTIRIGAGLPQIFGTQATRRGDVLYILPMLNDDKVDEWRLGYDLPPLAFSIKMLERQYLLPVLRSQRLSGHSGTSGTSAVTKELGISDPDEAIKVETKAVNLNVIVQSPKGQTPLGTVLTKDDFAVFEDGVEQEATFFSAADSPFDMVLVLDFSGSTVEKRGLMKKAAKRFVEFARPNDRIAIIAFANGIDLIAELTTDKDALYRAIDKINVDGNSPVWDSLKFAYDEVIKKDRGRRTAAVFMTDGEDNASKITFADLMEVVRHGETTVFPIYLNSINANESQKDFLGRLESKLHQSLTMLADETGGQSYKATDIKDLNGIYEQVINDIGKIYTIGYEPKNEDRDGGWRFVEVKLPHSTGLTAKTRRGYYAN